MIAWPSVCPVPIRTWERKTTGSTLEVSPIRFSSGSLRAELYRDFVWIYTTGCISKVGSRSLLGDSNPYTESPVKLQVPPVNERELMCEVM